MAAMGPGNRLPPDWNYAVTRDGRVFFINEIQRETTWLHPLTGQAVQTGYERVKGLPMGWEQGLTQDEHLYFINHNNRVTTFEHPVTGNVSNKKLTFRDYGYPAPTSPEEKQIKRNVKQRNVKVPVPAAKRNPNAIVIKRGWLHRYESSGIGKKTWRKRWCVLAEYALFFYKDESEQQTLASILLPSYRINNCDSSDVINKAFAFKIEHENTKTCYLAADSIDDLNSWLHSVQEAATLKDSPQFHRETNNNLTNFSRLNNMKLIPKSPIIVSHDDSDDEIPFYEKLSEWEKSWKSPGPTRKHGDPGRGGHDPYESDNYGDYPMLRHGDSRSSHNNQQHHIDPRSVHKDDPRSRYSNSQNSDENSPRGLQRWHNENLGSGNNLRPDILEVERDLRHQSMASDRSDHREFDNNPFNPDNPNAAVHRNSYDPKGISYSSLKENSPLSREQLQRMSYDGAYSPKRAENQRDMTNQKDFPGRYIGTAYHPSLQDLPGPAAHRVPNDRIFPEFQDRTQSQPNLTGSIADHHRFGPPKPPERDSSFNHKINPYHLKNQGSNEASRIQGRPPVAAPRSQIPNQNKPPHIQEPNIQRDRDSYASSRPRDSFVGTGQRNSFYGANEQRNNTQDDQRNSYVGAGGQRDSYQGSVGHRNSFHGAPEPRSNDPRNSYAGSQREPKHLQDPRERNSYQSNPRDSFPGNPRDSFPGNQRDSFPGNPRDSFPGNSRDSFPGNQRDSYPNEAYNQRNSYSRNQQDGYPGDRKTQDDQIQPERHHPVAAPRKSLSPDRNPGLTIDIPPNYINLPPGSHPNQNAPENGPHRPPYPSSYRQQMIEDLAKDKTPKTSSQYLTSAENERRRMEQSPFFQYPSNNQQQSAPRGQGQQPPRKDGWEDNSAKELRAAYERVQQLQNSQKSSDPNIQAFSSPLNLNQDITAVSGNTCSSSQQFSHMSLSNPSTLIDPSMSPMPLQGQAMLEEKNSPKYAVPFFDNPPPITRLLHLSEYENQFSLKLQSESYQIYGHDTQESEPSPVYEIPCTDSQLSSQYTKELLTYHPNLEQDRGGPYKDPPAETVIYSEPKLYEKMQRTNTKIDIRKPQSDFEMQRTSTKTDIRKPQSNFEMQRTSTKIDIRKPQSDFELQRTSTKIDMRKPQSDFELQRTSTKIDIRKPQSEFEMQRTSTKADMRKPQSDFELQRTSTKIDIRKLQSEFEMQRTSTKTDMRKQQSELERNILDEISLMMKQAQKGEITFNISDVQKHGRAEPFSMSSIAEEVEDSVDSTLKRSEYYDSYYNQTPGLYGTVNKKNKPNKSQFAIHTVKEDPNMSDKDILTTTEIKNLNKKYPLNGSRIRMSISANDLIGKNHDELVLLLIQLRRNQSALEKAKEFYKLHLDQRKPSEKQYRKQKQDSPGYMDRELEEEHNNYRELKHQLDEIDNKLEVYRPIINLVDNMVTMGSLYGGDNLMLASQYRRHLLRPDQYTEAKDMIDFSRQRQEKKMVQEIEDEIKNLTDEEVDLEDELERLYELDRRLQEQSFLVTSFSEDKEMLEKALQGIIKQQDQKRDDPREMRALIHQQRTIEKELSRVTQQLAEASRLLEETTAENNKIEHEVALLRTKVHGDLQRSKSAPSLVGDNERTKRKMEKELAKVQTMITGLNKEGERLQQAMSTIRRSSSGTQLASLLDTDEDKPLKKASTYMQTDLDSLETIDLAKPPRSSMSMPDISSLHIDPTAYDSPTSNYTVMSSPKRTVLPDESEYVAFNPSPGQEQMRSKSLNELNKEPPPPPPRAFKQPLISHQRQQSSVAPPSEMYNSNHGDIDDDAWDIGDADDNTKRFFGLIPREKPKAVTVRDVKRQAEQRRERGRRGDDLTDDESTRWSLAEGDEPIGISHVRYPSDSTGSLLSGPAHETIDGYSQPLYENLPRAKSVPSLVDSENSSRRSSLVLMAPKPFTPYQARPASALGSVHNQPNQEVELPSFMQKKVSTLSSSKPYNSEINIPTYQKDGLRNESNSWKNQASEQQSLPWLKSGSQLMGGVLNVNKTPGGRYTTITSSQPSKLEVMEPVSTTPLQTNISSQSTDDFHTNRSIDEVPDVVKSSTNPVSKIDEYSIDDILRGPKQVLIPERYVPDEEDEEIVSEDELIKRQEKAAKFKKILAQQSIHSFSQPDISRDNLDAHEKARQDKEMRNELLGVGQELARQVTQKSKRDAKAAAERRKTWSGGQFAEAMSQVNRNMVEISRTQDTDLNYMTYQQRENIYI